MSAAAVHLDVESVPAWIRLAHELDRALHRSFVCPASSWHPPRHCRILARSFRALRCNLLRSALTPRCGCAPTPRRDRPRLRPLSRSLNPRGEGRRRGPGSHRTASSGPGGVGGLQHLPRPVLLRAWLGRGWALARRERRRGTWRGRAEEQRTQVEGFHRSAGTDNRRPHSEPPAGRL